MSKVKEHVAVIVDGIQLNGRHFAAFSKAEAVNKMIADGITTDPAWAGGAYDKIKAAVEHADNPSKVAAPAEEKSFVNPIGSLSNANMKGKK